MNGYFSSFGIKIQRPSCLVPIVCEAHVSLCTKQLKKKQPMMLTKPHYLQLMLQAT